VSLGKKKKGLYEYRLRWDSVIYKPGVLRVVTYKNGTVWATDRVKTAGEAAALALTADRTTIKGDAKDLSFITVRVLDQEGSTVPRADNRIRFEITGPGEIIATDNGDPADLEAFPSKDRKAYSGMAIVIVRARAGVTGQIKITAQSPGLTPAEAIIHVR
jgi:beta-galactosidase